MYKISDRFFTAPSLLEFYVEILYTDGVGWKNMCGFIQIFL
jgi:hypothetical protein